MGRTPNGVKAAAKVYFDKPLDKLTLGKAALARRNTTAVLPPMNCSIISKRRRSDGTSSSNKWWN